METSLREFLLRFSRFVELKFYSASKRQLPASRVVFGDAREVLKTNIAATAQKLPVGKFSIDDLIEEIRSLSNGDKKQVNDMTRYYLFNMNKRQFSLVDGSGGG